MAELKMINRRGQLLLVGMDREGDVILKARLPACAGHPRAAITLLEGLALWSGHKLPVAVGVNGASTAWIADLLPDGPPWCSPLVDLHLVDHPRPRRRLRLDGVGDLRPAIQLRLPVLT